MAISQNICVATAVLAFASATQAQTREPNVRPQLKAADFSWTLVAVGCDDEMPAWWTPTGHELPECPYENDRGGKVFADGRAVQFVFRIDEQRDADRIWIRVEGATGQQSRDAELKSGEPAMVIKAFIPEDFDHGEITVARAGGKFRKALSILGKNNASTSNGMVALAVLEPTGDDAHTQLHASIAIDSRTADHRLVAVDTAKNRHVATKTSRGQASAGGRSASLVRCDFEGLSFEDYAGVELQTRPFEMHTIQGIPLRTTVGKEHRNIQVTFQPAAPPAKASLDWNRAVLRDWDDDQADVHVLDLATLDQLPWNSDDEIQNQALICQAKNKGDLVWHKSLIALRGATITDPETGKELAADKSIPQVSMYYDVAAKQRHLITTAEGDQYLLVIHRSPNDDEGITVMYRYVPESAER